MTDRNSDDEEICQEIESTEDYVRSTNDPIAAYLQPYDMASSHPKTGDGEIGYVEDGDEDESEDDGPSCSRHDTEELPEEKKQGDFDKVHGYDVDDVDRGEYLQILGQLKRAMSRDGLWS